MLNKKRDFMKEIGATPIGFPTHTNSEEIIDFGNGEAPYMFFARPANTH
jgi:hypothetical protein